MSFLGPSLQAVPNAIVMAFNDVVNVFEFTAINYATSMIIGTISPSLPGGLPNLLITSSINSAGEVAKLILFNANLVKAPSAI